MNRKEKVIFDLFIDFLDQLMRKLTNIWKIVFILFFVFCTAIINIITFDKMISLFKWIIDFVYKTAKNCGDVQGQLST